MNDFITEIGAVISEENDMLSLVEGTPGSVDFPTEFILDVHRARPGFVAKLAHTHPPGMTELSGRDRQTLKTWAFTIYPFVMRMSTITKVDGLFRETTYMASLEPKELWKVRGGERKFEITKEYEFDFIDPRPVWMSVVLEKSYGYKSS